MVRDPIIILMLTIQCCGAATPPIELHPIGIEALDSGEYPERLLLPETVKRAAWRDVAMKTDAEKSASQIVFKSYMLRHRKGSSGSRFATR